MVSDEGRVRGSAAISMASHGALLGAYLLLRATAAQNQPALTRIEFMDLRPEPVAAPAAPAAAQRAPASIKEFLKMALPRFTPAPSAPQDVMEAPKVHDAHMQDVRVAPSLKIDDSRAMQRSSPLRLSGPQLIRESQAALSDVAHRPSSSRPADLSPVDVKPDLQLDAVGRRAAPGGAAPAIRIDPNASVARGEGSMRDIAAMTAASLPRGAAAAGIETGGIRLVDEPGPARAGRLPEPAIGYGRGGGGLSLQERAVARPAAVKLPAERAAEKTKMEAKLKTQSDKAVEISGPLATRKVVSLSLPAYPEWAKEKGVETEVSIRFFVSAEGRVRDRVFLERTCGYDELDRLCMEAIKKWTFVPLSTGGEEADQWGVITFRFRLK